MCFVSQSCKLSEVFEALWFGPSINCQRKKRPCFQIFPHLYGMSKYKNIIFDLGGVLMDIDYHLTHDAFIRLGVKNFDEMYSQAEANELFQQLEKGLIDQDEFYTALNKQTGLGLSKEDMADAWNALLLDFRESSLDYISELKSKANLILLSNTNAIHRDAFYAIYNRIERQHPFEEYFHHCVYSFDTGTRKPDKESFQWVIDQTGIDPKETIFIDDSPQNVETARQMGIHSILLEKGRRVEDLGLEDLLQGGG